MSNPSQLLILEESGSMVVLDQERLGSLRMHSLTLERSIARLRTSGGMAILGSLLFSSMT